MTLDIPKISSFIESCANEMRLKILYEVYKSPKYPKEITSLTSLTGGALYHHLDVLVETGLISRDELGRVILTEDGKHLSDVVFTIIGSISGGRDIAKGKENIDWTITREPSQDEPQSKK
jgi:DNA-binding transcriptional ArsR family regulator